MEADLGESVVGPGGEGQPLTALRPHLRLRPKDRRAPPAPWTALVGRGAGAEPTDIPRAFSSDLDHPGAWAFSIGRIQDFWIGLAIGGGESWGRRALLGGRLSERGSRLRTAGGGGGRRSSGDLGPHPSRADFREQAGEGSRPGGRESPGSKLGRLGDRKVFEVWGRTGLLLKMGPFWGARSSSRMVESSGPN